MSQIWLGTTYGAVVVLNAISYSNGENTQHHAETSNTNQKPIVITVSGTVFTLKGQILEIAFLDLSGNLMTPINSNLNSSKVDSSGCNSSSAKKQSSNIDDEDDLDFNFVPNAQILSNSIADNFYGQSHSTTTALQHQNSSSSNLVNNELNSTSGASSSSPNVTPTTTFVNPFSNSVPPPPPLSADDVKIFTKSTKSTNYFLLFKNLIFSKLNFF